MELKIKRVRNFLFTGILLTGAIACNKTENNFTADAIPYQQFSMLEIEDDNLQLMADQAEADGSLSTLRVLPGDDQTYDVLGDCPTITRDSSSTPRT
jgi:hypothetical protein